MSTFFKVIVIKVDMFESVIVDERHFSSNAEAVDYSSKMTSTGYVAVVMAM